MEIERHPIEPGKNLNRDTAKLEDKGCFSGWGSSLMVGRSPTLGDSGIRLDIEEDLHAKSLVSFLEPKPDIAANRK